MPPDQDQRRLEFVRSRKALEMTQKELADVLDRSTSWVRDIESGRIKCPMYAVYAMRYLMQNER